MPLPSSHNTLRTQKTYTLTLPNILLPIQTSPDTLIFILAKTNSWDAPIVTGVEVRGQILLSIHSTLLWNPLMEKQQTNSNSLSSAEAEYKTMTEGIQD
ncbi:hypothetical protein O181_022862 [Austropuccinia psidii MF-1]|uniref:Uncharacterized protein n=1 Tax=Austropuccinia psidii MF-1 TaxID=1389203 RepID=A0A9Q3GXJ2_9BASI|nr:hypothetical protein [Austropuccinia psidii MF-1]